MSDHGVFTIHSKITGIWSVICSCGGGREGTREQAEEWIEAHRQEVRSAAKRRSKHGNLG